MSQVLIISTEPRIPQSLQEALTTPDFRLTLRTSPDLARTALERHVFDLCVVYASGDSASLSEHLAALRAIAPSLRLIVITSSYSAPQEAASFAGGADLYLAEPISGESLRRMIAPGRDPYQQAGSEQAARPEPVAAPDALARPGPVSALHVLRDFSHVLGFSLDYKAFTQHFILKLREHISFSRIAIFIEESAKQSFVKYGASNQLSCIASLGVPGDLIDCFQLSRGIGLGRALSEHPRIIHTGQSGSNADPTIRKEFAILGCQWAVPVTDRERLIGLAVLSGPVTGRGYSEDELQLLYLLMEELGMAIRNSRLHLDLSNHGQLVENVLSSISSGAIVIDEDLNILYANESARHFLKLEEAKPSAIRFADLPSQLASKVHRAVEKGGASEPFFLNGPREDLLLRASILPLTQSGELHLLPQPTMVLLEDFTKIEANKQSALDDSKEELISLIAERFAHEIRNALVPLSTHAQLIDKRIDDPKFHKSLKASLLRETARIKRFSEQMLFLAQTPHTGESDIELSDLLQAAFKKAKKQLNLPAGSLEINPDAYDGPVVGNPEALAYAFEELFLNALQANPENPVVSLRVHQSQEGIIRIRMRDTGPGFSEIDIDQAPEPFFTTRNTGVGLGLSVARKVINEHQGFLHLNRRSEERDWDLEIELPELLTPTKNA